MLILNVIMPKRISKLYTIVEYNQPHIKKFKYVLTELMNTHSDYNTCDYCGEDLDSYDNQPSIFNGKKYVCCDVLCGSELHINLYVKYMRNRLR
jgi:hypothetical protein